MKCDDNRLPAGLTQAALHSPACLHSMSRPQHRPLAAAPCAGRLDGCRLCSVHRILRRTDRPPTTLESKSGGREDRVASELSTEVPRWWLQARITVW
jgi:hypothetical protein